MVDPLEAVRALFDVAGPFLFPVVIFAFGAVGYGLLVALGRAGVVDTAPEDRPAGDGEQESDDDRTRPDRSRRG